MNHVDTPHSVCYFGLARCDITPPVGIYHRMWGAATHDRATGVHRPLTATALFFQTIDEKHKRDHRQVLVALDHCLLWDKEMQAVLLAASEAIEPEQIAITFSHTHAAGLMGLERAQLPGGELIPAYLDSLGRKISDIIDQARKSAQDATILYGVGRCSLAAQRDFWDAETRQYVCGFNPEGPTDDTVVVARVLGPGWKPLATIVNYACHPTTLAWENTLISPDFPGAMREVVERATATPCVFLQGASGDLGPREGYLADVEVADRNGRQLGYAALAALEALPLPRQRFTYLGPLVSGATLGLWGYVPFQVEKVFDKARWQQRRWTVDLPYRPGLSTAEETRAERQRWETAESEASAAGDDDKARDCRAMAERMTRRLTRLENLPAGRTFPYPVKLWRIGDAVWLAVEGELYNHFQRELRRRFPGVPIVIATLTNGSRPSYLPTADVYGKGIYQESIAVLAPGSLETLLEAVATQVKSCLG
jgi:hypothetical protein